MSLSSPHPMLPYVDSFPAFHLPPRLQESGSPSQPGVRGREGGGVGGVYLPPPAQDSTITGIEILGLAEGYARSW